MPDSRTGLPSPRIAHDRLRLLIVAAYVVLGFVYAFATPIFEKNDEESHAWFIRRLAAGGGLPIQIPGAPGASLQREGSQPPLYYALATPVFSLFDSSDFDRELQANPSPSAQPYTINNKNLLLITPEKRAFNYQGATLAMVTIRLLGIIPGALVVWWTYDIAGALTRNRACCLLAMALTAFNPMFLTVSTSVANDGLVIALSTAGLLLIIRLATHGATLKRLVLLGTVIALASLAKVSGLILLPVAAVAIVGRAGSDSASWRSRIRSSASQVSFIGLIWLVIAGWWYARNLVLYQDPTGVTVMAQMMTPRSITLSQALGEFGGFIMSYVAIFGQFTIHADAEVYIAFDVLLIAGAFGLLLGGVLCYRARRRDPVQAPFLLGALLALHIVLLLASIVRWTMMTPASQGRLLFPAIASVSTLLAIGLLQLTRLRPLAGGWLAALVGGAALLLAVVSPFRYIIPAYTPPLVSHLPDGMIPATQRMGDLAELTGYTMTPTGVHPGEKVRVSAVLRALGATPENFLLVVKLYGRDKQVIARFETYTGNGLLPSSLWRVGNMWRDDVEFTVPTNAQAPAVMSAQFELYNRGAGTLLPNSDLSGKPGAPLFAGSTLLPPLAPLTHTALATVGDIVALADYTRTPAMAGQTITVTLLWHTLKQATEDYTVFVHLVDQNGHLLSQHDGPPDGGNYVTSRWLAGTTFVDVHPIALPAGLPSGRYILQVGWYDPATNQRLPLRDASATDLPDRAYTLEEITVR